MGDGRKNIIIMIKSSPFRGSFCEEALRASVGLRTTIEKNEIKVVFISDGVWFGLKDMKQFAKYSISLASLELPLIIEKESMELLKIKQEDLGSGYKIMSRNEISKLLKEAEIVITY